jgi:Zn-dependent protease
MFVMLVPSVILHEVSHGVVALWFGDDTAQQARRLTLNPVAHIDPFGTIILPLILIFTTGTGFGYAKPVPVNPRKLHNPRQQMVVVSLAGPIVNITLAVGAAIALKTWYPAESHLSGGFLNQPVSTGARALVALGLVNVLLAAFNLIPIPPLDGSAVVERFLPQQWWPPYLRFRQYSFGLLLILVLVLPGTLGSVFDGAYRLWLHLF